jgi:hypothetical protein
MENNYQIIRFRNCTNQIIRFFDSKMSLGIGYNGEYMASRRLRASNLSNRDGAEAGYNR